MNLILLALIILLILAVVGGFALTKFIWILAVILLIAAIWYFIAHRRVH